MTDVRCPMCGKPNPAESDTCQFCDARLKPLIAGTPPASDAPDWLDGLRDEQGNSFELSESADSQDESDDWLARLGAAVDSAPAGSDEADTPDWMSSLGDTDLEATAAFTSPDLGSEDLFAAEAAGDTATGSDIPEFSPEEWFTDRGETPAEPASEAENAGADWFSQSAETDLPEAEDDQPDWFKETSPQAEASASSPFDSSSLFDDQADDEETRFDWQAAEAGPEKAAEEPAQPAGELPDWLNWGAADEETAAVQETPAEDQAPDWLSAMSVSQESEAAPEDSAAAWSSDWPAAESASPESDGGETPVVWPFSFLEEDEEETAAFGLDSDWSSGGLGETAHQPAPEPQPESDEPDWLSSLNAESEVPSFSFDELGSDQTDGEPEETAVVSPFAEWGGDNQPPDWLLAAAGAEAENAQPASVPAFSFDDEPGMDETVPTPLEAAPDWMSQVSAEDVAPASIFPMGEEEPEQADQDLAPASLPGWLEAMRPVDAIALEDFKDTSDERMETQGPLAGLRGALPVGLDDGKVAAPPAHSFKIQVSEETNTRLKMLTDLLAAETQPLKPASGIEFMTGALIRLVLFVALMLTAIWSLWFGEQPGTIYLQSASLPPAASAFQQQMSLLPGEPVVLVAVEAETAFAGEMDAAAEALLTFLTARRAKIYFVSTNSAGPILAERYIDNLDQQPSRGGTAYKNYANLGYLSGGPAGLVAFLNAPENFTPLDLSGHPAWDTPSGSGKTGLLRFDAVIVMTANSENARLWVEQAGPLLHDQAIPLLFSVSAQVTPMLQPYFKAEPRQVDGILSGLPETYQFTYWNALEQLSGEAGEAQRVIDAYSAVVLAAVIILLIGIVVNLMSHLLPARSKERNA